MLRNSELAELWAEAAAETGTNEWHVSITGLVDRLNPDVEFVPWEPADIEKQAGGPIGHCAFCDGPIDRKSLFGMNIHDYSDQMSFPTGLWFHLPCLNARLHHKHAIIDLKFDPDNLPDPRQALTAAKVAFLTDTRSGPPFESGFRLRHGASRAFCPPYKLGPL